MIAPAPQSSRLSASSVRRSAHALAPSAAVDDFPSVAVIHQQIGFIGQNVACAKLVADAGNNLLRADAVDVERNRAAAVRNWQ